MSSDCQDGTSLLDEPLEQAGRFVHWEPFGSVLSAEENVGRVLTAAERVLLRQ